ncbi:DUF4199 domain-containing protein [Mangrovimonas spongiae]|uniref:DUF4199 domain-containing protein n=1 Tax=Mangrovimonas spongiae TaxID=2494697 RepID=A0A3R9PJ05_9FLAO|nr:DUF4199 domain-containing protein [Mangrovimonas spongiae]RSK39323.1 DUF4199 domain-containing protein [Mangrovimonas spongiae]
MEKSVKSIAINYGLYLGGILALLSVLAYAINLDLYTKAWYGIALLLLVIVFGIISTVKTKSALKGIISFKEAFTSYFLTVLIGIAISSVVSILIFNVIDPEAAIVLKEKIVDSQVQMMRNFGAPEEAVAEAVEKMETEGNMFSIGNVVQSLVFQLVGFSIVGLIVALVLKKNEENA